MYNGLNVLQTRNFIRLSCETYIDKICKVHEKTWMKSFHISDDRPTPLPTTEGFIKSLPDEPSVTDDTGATEDTGDVPKAVCSPVMNLEIVPLDIWGQDAD